MQALNSGREQATEAVQRLQADVKRLTRELSELKVKAAVAAAAARTSRKPAIKIPAGSTIS